MLVFQFKPVQTWAAKQLADHYAKQWGTKVYIGGLYIRPFSSVVLDSMYVLDKQQDTLINTPKLTVQLNGFSIFSSISEHKLDLSLIQLDNGSFYLKKQKDSTTNLDFILNSFKSADTAKTAQTPAKPWSLIFEKIVVNNFRFRYINHLVDTVMSNRINFEDLDVSHFSADIRNMDIVHHYFKGDVRHLSLHEKSGFQVNSFKAMATVDSNQILAQNLSIVTPNSDIKNYFRMRFRSFGDMGDFENKVLLNADFRSARVSSADIAYFTSTLHKTRFDLGVDGQINGMVSNLKAKHLTITAGQATWLKGDFNLKGLPDWDNTFLELDFEQVASNKKDLDNLYNRFSGTTNRKLPTIIDKFGNFSFKGKFTGLQNDFIAYGEFKTKMGRFRSDVNLKISKAGRPSYSGNIKAYDFDLGTLLNQPDLGSTTFNADVKGSGDALDNITEQVKAQIAYIDYNQYRYHHVDIDGSVAKKVFSGAVDINDDNINLSLKGSADINPANPVYNLSGSIIDARLHTLHLLADTITLSANLNTQFSGSNLANLTGKIQLMPIRIIDPRHNYLVDSVTLSASGTGHERLISLQSPLAEGSIKGNYDLATLPAYFKTIVKKYIPSLKTEAAQFKPQQFDFNFKIKDIDPLVALFAPNLKIPDQGTFTGQFNSANQTATLNGYVKTINYGGMVFHDLILDESTSDGYLGLNLSLNKVDLSKDLFIKNINISNFLSKDSLKFNVKLSDLNATNQLDLYGLVEFGRDTTAKLKLLPSEVILEHEKWKIQDQVRIRLLNGKTEVQGFELSRGTQKVRINGFISDNTADKLKVEFDKFSMATFNQLTRPAGVELHGNLNGNVILNAVTKSPGIDSHLGIDTLTMNETLIGNVKLVADLDKQSNQANVKLNILNRGLETLNISGLYKLGKDAGNNSLDFDVKMNQTEAIIFDPFVKDLVSNLKGTVSTDLKLTGTPADPQLNGKVTLANTGVTVNYLKTAYIINDEVTVANSVIKIDKMTLTDVRGNKAIANGTVDLTNINTPDIEVTVDAKNFQALNTTFKDNHLYFGKAYGTGKFTFSGPTDNMDINIKATTEDSTVFNIPLNTSSTANDYDFVKFVSHTDTTKVADQVNAFKGVTLSLELNVDEKTLLKITTDYGKLEGRGVANNLKLNINSLGDFEMFGDFQITSGKFEFTAKNFISKNFIVNQGGTIRWTSNPSNADINLKAIYEVRAGINNLYTAAGLSSPQGDQQKLVQAELILTNTLLQPKIDFDFNFPTDPSIKDDVATYLRDESNRNQQALSLIVRRQFAAGTANNLTNQVASTAGEALSEFAFNKLNTFISQSNIRFADVNIRSTSDASATLRFLNDRLLFSGSLYSPQGTNNLFDGGSSFLNANINSFTKDFEADYLIRPDGHLKAHYSYRVLNSTTLDLYSQLSVQYVNGVGLVYQRDFDTLGEFVKSLFSRKRKPATPNSKILPTTPGDKDSPDNK